VRCTSGVCRGCDVMIENSEMGVQFDSDNPERLLIEACAA
jgi:hypothetical protein